MKAVGSFVHAYRWAFILMFGALLPNLALAAKGKITLVAQQACESQVSAKFKKKAVEVAVASLVGDLSELEATKEREGLEHRLETEKATCRHQARAAASTGSL